MSAAIAGAETGRARSAWRGLGALQRAERMINYFRRRIARHNDTDPAAVPDGFPTQAPKLRRQRAGRSANLGENCHESSR